MDLPRDEPPSAELTRYVRLSHADGQALAGVRSRVQPHFETIVAAFYERIREHEGAHAVIRSDEQVQRLQRALVGWLERVFSGTYHESYFAETAAIGRTHVRVGLPPRYLPVAMGLLRTALLEVLSHPGDEPARAALGKLCDLELAIMLDAHEQALLSRVARASANEEVSAHRATPFEEHAVTAIEVSPLLVVGLDADGAIVLFNRAAERLTGYAQDELLGRDFTSVLLPEEARASFAFPSSDDLELPLVTRAGRRRMVRWQRARVESSSVAFAFGRDITDDHATRERDQQQRRLVAMAALTTGLAHEIRNPLNGARLHAELLERSLSRNSPLPETTEAIRVVKDEIARLARLVDDFLEFAQPRALVRTELDACALARRVAAAAVSANVHVDAPSAALIFAADGARVEQALSALVDNALEAGASEVTLRVRREPRAVRFEVEDNGPGFDARSPVFDAFYTTKADGTGLGLAIVHRTVTDHRGSIDVESRAGYTRFRLLLPLDLEGTNE